MRPRKARLAAPAPRLKGDEGALIIELAFVAPLMVMLLLGIFEFGTAWRNKTIVVSALRAAARIESQNPKTANVDQTAIQTFMAGISGLTNMHLERIVIYDAPALGFAPTNCRTTAISATTLTPLGRGSPSPSTPVAGTNCNIYNNAMAYSVASGAPPAGVFNSACGSSTWHQFYCPALRANTLNGSGGGRDLIGVYAEFTYTDVTNLIPGGTITFTDQVSYTAQPIGLSRPEDDDAKHKTIEPAPIPRAKRASSSP